MPKRLKKAVENPIKKFAKSFVQVPCRCDECKADVSVSIADVHCPGCGKKETLKVRKRPY